FKFEDAIGALEKVRDNYQRRNLFSITTGFFKNANVNTSSTSRAMDEFIKQINDISSNTTEKQYNPTL
ncbi:MAG: hypothetical protein HYX60_04915, partial [Legionella longbeachae]|nr:hypothetical protein [Legionella longbeachae]